ncbi:DNA repair protein rad52 [Scheffersomyces spartinae]|uniref:DNA repair and recombination protein RAD52 n=1 Tax=Scheffersomyces spartinae TaxID=45513 RepID=A0A9P7V5X0_9ASCO|nr:DNA repair protein rad52 [Scheffersomyces spartinae]KAG7191867.1 DNA repair protein rad52 [Scheffersomyces spartinae]
MLPPIDTSSNKRPPQYQQQHIEGGVNPAVFKKPRLNEDSSRQKSSPTPYTQREQHEIQGKLNKVLGPEYISFRPGGGGQKVAYIEGWRALNLANEIFGFNGWSSELVSTQVDYFDTHGQSGKYSLGLAVLVRITLKDGTFHEDFGYGFIDNAKSRAMAFEKCRKEAFTDAVKRCLRCFGNVLGNCLYDKTIIQKIHKFKLDPHEYTTEDFHRDPLIAQREQLKKESTFSSIPGSSTFNNNPTTSTSTIRSMSVPPQPGPNSNSNSNGIVKSSSNGGVMATTKQIPISREVMLTASQEAVKFFGTDDPFTFSDDIGPEDDDNVDMDGIDDMELQQLEGRNRELADSSRNNSDDVPQAMFVSAKIADRHEKDGTVPLKKFDTNFISSSIRRTLDPTKSVPVKKAEVLELYSQQVNDSHNNVNGYRAGNEDGNGNTSVLGKRLIGAPPSVPKSSPSSQQFRPPMKRPHKETSQLDSG